MGGSSLSETLDRRIDSIIKEWHQNSDLLFAVHPIDGSLLVWVADFLDEYQPGAFRQVNEQRNIWFLGKQEKKPMYFTDSAARLKKWGVGEQRELE